MNKIKHFIIGLSLGLALLGVAPTQTAAAAPIAPLQNFAACPPGVFLTFPTWYKGLPQDPTSCAVKIAALNDIWVIVLNLVEILLQVSGYVAAGFIIWGGFKYMKSQGNPQNIASAKSTIMDASIGLGIALSSVAIVRYVAGLF